MRRRCVPRGRRAARVRGGQRGIALGGLFAGAGIARGFGHHRAAVAGLAPIAVRSRNNQLALAAANQLRPAIEAAIARYGASRVAVVVGTSTSGIGESETAIREYVAAGALPQSSRSPSRSWGRWQRS